MKKLNLIQLFFAASLLCAVVAINGCKKETPVKPIAPITVVPMETDSANYFKGLLGNESVKFEGNALAYSAYVDPDSAHNHGNGHDYDSYYQSGSKWVTLSGTGLNASVNASVELRSLAVRVFVSPIVPISTVYFNLLAPASYPFADGDDSNTGAYISLHDSHGTLWTSTGDQDGSTLTITTRGANMNTYTVVSGTITCKMYDAVGNMKQLTGAKFTAALGI